jgi:hypothetical protein
MLKGVDRLFVVALAIMTIVYVAVFGYYLQATAIRVPVYDLLGWILHYADAWQRGDWWGYLWQAHNEHRVVFSRLLLLADIAWLRGTTLPFMVFSLLCLVGMIALIVREVAASNLPAGLKLTLALCVPLLLATTYIVVDCSMPALGVYVHTAAFFVLALVLLDGADEEGQYARLRRILALLAAVGAAFGIAGGLIAWPVLLWAGWRGGLKQAWLLSIAALGLVFVALYAMGIHSRASAGSLDPTRVLRMLDYSVRFLGLPWSHAASLVWVGRIAGSFILVAGLGVIVKHGFLDAPGGRLERIGLGMVLFALLIAALAGTGRVDVASDRAMPIRYSIFAAMAELGLLITAAPWLASTWRQSRGRHVLQAGLMAASVLLLAQQLAAGRAGAAVAAQYTEAYRKFASGLWTGEMAQFVHPNRATAERGRAIVQSLGIYQTY